MHVHGEECWSGKEGQCFCLVCSGCTQHTRLDWLLDECAPLFDSALLMMQVSAKGVSAMALRCEVCNVSFLLFCMFVHPSKMP